MDQDTDEDIEAKYYANLHYVDTETVESPKDVSENDTNLSNSAKTNKLLSRRYWSKPISQNIDNPNTITNNDVKPNAENFSIGKIENDLKHETLETKIEQPKNLTINESAPIKNIKDNVVLENDNIVVSIATTPDPVDVESNLTAYSNDVQSNGSRNMTVLPTSTKKKKKRNKKNRQNKPTYRLEETISPNMNFGLAQTNRQSNPNDTNFESTETLIAVLENSNRYMSFQTDSNRNALITNLMHIRNNMQNGNIQSNQLMSLHRNLQKLIRIVPIASLDDNVQRQITAYQAGLEDALNTSSNCRYTNQIDPWYANIPVQKRTYVPNNTTKKGLFNKSNKNILTPSKESLKIVNKTPIAIKLNEENDKKSDVIKVDDSSDDESVIEIPVIETPNTICIDSSEDECEVNTAKDETNVVKTKGKLSNDNINKTIPNATVQQISPSPSIHSSTSDDFIQQDVNNLKGNCVFNFALHGTDFSSNLNKNNEAPSTSTADNTTHVFATPKSKKRKLNPLNKSYTISDSGPITPFLDVYDSESSDIPESITELPVTPVSTKRFKKNPLIVGNPSDSALTLNITSNKPKVLTEIPDYGNKGLCPLPDFVTSVIGPKSIVDGKVTHEECDLNMKKFYNCSWGGEVFDHVKLKRQMPNNKEKWEINLADKYCTESRHKLTCLRCCRRGHREDRCPKKPKICHMCGTEGHFSTKCPKSICLNCGANNYSFTKECQHCKKSKKQRCKTCNAHGHPTSLCTDMWRRYHLTTVNEIPLVKNTNRKPDSELYCPGCGQRGHTSADCRANGSQCLSSFVFNYTPIYTPDGVRNVQLNAETKAQNLTKNVNKDKDRSTQKRGHDSEVKHNSPKRIKTSKNEEQESLEHAPVETATTSQNTETNTNSSQVLLTTASSRRLQSNEGIAFLSLLSCKFNSRLKIQSSVVGNILVIRSNPKLLSSIQNDLKSWLSKKETSRDTLSIPSNRLSAIELLQTELDLLKERIVNPRILFKTLTRLRISQQRIIKASGLKSYEASTITTSIHKATRSLNMTLIGKLGLMAGNQYVSRLIQALESLKKLNTNNIEGHMIAELERCYNAVFSTEPRDDYLKLIKCSERSKKKNIRRIKNKKTQNIA